MSKQLRSWRPYEAAYVKAMALCGIGKSECVERLWEVNSTVGAPYRSENTVKRMANGLFKKHINAMRPTRNIPVTWPAVRVNKTLGGRFWEPWESAYIALLSNDGLSFATITAKLAVITHEIGRPSRNIHAVSSKLFDLSKNEIR